MAASRWLKQYLANGDVLRLSEDVSPEAIAIFDPDVQKFMVKINRGISDPTKSVSDVIEFSLSPGAKEGLLYQGLISREKGWWSADYPKWNLTPYGRLVAHLAKIEERKESALKQAVESDSNFEPLSPMPQWDVLESYMCKLCGCYVLKAGVRVHREVCSE